MFITTVFGAAENSDVGLLPTRRPADISKAEGNYPRYARHDRLTQQIRDHRRSG